MKRIFLLKGLDCPNCSAKIEKEVGELDGVQSSVVNLMKQTLTINVTQTAADTIASQIETIVHSHEPDVEVQEETVMNVTKSYSLKGLDCPNCSAKIEKEVGELDGVQSSVVNLMKQTLTINVAQTSADTIASQIETIVHSHEPDVEVSENVQESYIPEKKQEANESYNNEDKKLTVRLAIGAAIYAIGMALTVFAKVRLPIELAFLIVSYVILGGDVVWQAVRNISKGRVFDEHFLMSVSTIGAFVIGEYPEAVAVMLFYQVGEFFQSLAVKRSRKSISDLMDIRPDSATVRRNGELITISPENVSIGEIIIVKPGEKIPLDGVVLDGDSMLDTRALTGESVPRSVHKGDEALSGCMNQTGVLMIKTTKAFGESTASKIIDLVENASSRKAPTENFITTFARYYTPVVVILAAFLAILPPIILGGGWTEWIRRGFVFLVVSCPCALVISIPLTFFGGIGAASKRGVLVKGSNYLEALNNVSVIVFDKTGTLTKGVFNVTDILPANGFSKEQVLEYAAEAESFSNHPIAKSILAAYEKEIDQSVISDYKEISGYGISVMAGEKKVFAGNTKLMDTECIEYTTCEKAGTKVYLAVDGQYAGCILITDEVKPDSKKAISDLKHIGVEKTVMLTGDDEKIGKSVAEELQLDEYYAQLLPDQKVEKVELLDSKKRPGSKLAFVGDGINDAPVLARADVGIAMGGLGSDAAIEAADVVLMTDEPSKLVDAIEVAKATKQIVMQNIVIALGIKSVFLILGALGIAGMWEAVFGDVGVTIIAVLNAMRILKK
ncbi:heavy metal translocating P-type ATPase [Anaerostipes amylophilus]|uniref:heavy metal translocating P-type ATPase n=1 Tax=Anaerostipes amylophilus TaxID=2981779 RepID=UPI0006C2CF22|nr:heavy metal translocating P-type ATPase [Anaerostipes amylophilus]MCU6780823.1 heavy metal translocating P-type ATPase [Anaerostipes amylophilus]CUN70703.1 Cadmium%2C zinc and cobalt-transporting ATPase [Anaerostipes hadrus]